MDKRVVDEPWKNLRRAVGGGRQRARPGGLDLQSRSDGIPLKRPRGAADLHQAALDDQPGGAGGRGDDAEERLVAGNAIGKQQFVTARLFDPCFTRTGVMRNPPSGKRRPTSQSGMARTKIPFPSHSQRTGIAWLPSSPLMATWWEIRNLAGGPSSTDTRQVEVHACHRERRKPPRSGRRGVGRSSGRSRAPFQMPRAHRADASVPSSSTNTRCPWLRNSPR